MSINEHRARKQREQEEAAAAAEAQKKVQPIADTKDVFPPVSNVREAAQSGSQRVEQQQHQSALTRQEADSSTLQDAPTATALPRPQVNPILPPFGGAGQPGPYTVPQRRTAHFGGRDENGLPYNAFYENIRKLKEDKAVEASASRPTLGPPSTPALSSFAAADNSNNGSNQLNRQLDTTAMDSKAAYSIVDSTAATINTAATPSRPHEDFMEELDTFSKWYRELSLPERRAALDVLLNMKTENDFEGED